MNKTKPSIGILGAGKLSVVLSQLAICAGYDVRVSNAKDPKDLVLAFSVLSPGTEVVTRDELIRTSDVIILAIPLSKYKSIPNDTFDGKLIIDAMNYWWEVDGPLEAFHATNVSSSEQVQLYFSGARIVKAFNHIGYHDLHDHAAEQKSPNRRAVAIAGDNIGDNKVISQIVNDLGFDPLIIGDLKSGIALEPGSNTFGVSVNINELKSLVV